MCTKPAHIIWKVRAVKRYPEAHNHLLIGELRTKDRVYVEMNCRSFHFGRSVNRLKDIRVGEVGVRIVPWTHIEIVNVLPANFRYAKAELTMDREGNVLLRDRQLDYVCPIASRSEPRH